MNLTDVPKVFKAIDSADTDTFLSFLSEDAVFRFANMPQVEGKENILAFLQGFYQSIKGVSHDQIETWKAGEVLFMNGRVTYTRHDGSQLSAWFSNTFKLQGDKIKDYLIYVDASQLYN